MQEKEVVSVNQAGEYCRVSPQTIVNWINTGKLKAYKTAGGHRRIMKSDLADFLHKHNMPAFGSSSLSKDDSGAKRKRVLVVDDDPVIVQTITAALEEDRHNYEVNSASDGFEAGMKVGDFKPDLVILDIMMPGLDGYEVCHTLKTAENTRHVKIIVLSGYLSDENYRKMREFGADECFSKPFPLDQLKEEVARFLF
ncbi:MAG: response regulator [Syntrophobacteraceae bacterium]